MNALPRAAHWIRSWLVVGLVTNIATALLLVPAALPAWLVYRWLAPRLGWPPLKLHEVFALIFLIRLTQASASINVPLESTAPDRGVRQ